MQGLLFRENEAGYLAGYLAGLWAKDNNATTVSTVGGQKIPPVDAYIAGFQAGAKKAFPQVRRSTATRRTSSTRRSARRSRSTRSPRGSKVVFQVAGGCGLGALDAAKEEGVQGIGVDADQGYLGDHILTSALKKVDVAVFEAVERAQAGNFKGGTDVIATVENGGVGLGKISAEGEQYADQMTRSTTRSRPARSATSPRRSSRARSCCAPGRAGCLH